MRRITARGADEERWRRQAVGPRIGRRCRMGCHGSGGIGGGESWIDRGTAVEHVLNCQYITIQ